MREVNILHFVFVMCAACALASPAIPSKAHIVFMLVDDWGWPDVGYHRSTDIVTPNIDSLVKVGLQLDQHYVYNYCSPSCAALLSGRLPIHVNDADTSYNPNDLVSGYNEI